jgi:hypothetical protein
MSAQIFGNLTGGLMILETSGPLFYLIMGLVMMVAMLGFIVIKIPNKQEIILTYSSENDE